MTNSPFDFFDEHEYDQGFCACYKDPVACLVSYCIPCVAVGHTTGKLSDGKFNLWSCLCWPIGAYRNRRNVQAKNNINETEDGSMCAIGLCVCCAITQDMHEAGVKEAAAAAAAQPTVVEAPAREEAKKETAKK